MTGYAPCFRFYRQDERRLVILLIWIDLCQTARIRRTMARVLWERCAWRVVGESNKNPIVNVVNANR